MYQAGAVLLLNTLVALVVVNAFLYAGLEVYQHWKWRYRPEINVIFQKFDAAKVMKMYPGWSEGEVNRMLLEMWGRSYSYMAYSGFKEGEFHGKYVNVDKNGIRSTRNQGPWPPDPGKYNVFLLGGSTTFGYGVPDWQTVASYLQPLLAEATGKDVRIYNFGCSRHFSTQERILFQQLLAAGHRPPAVIFMDGLNEFMATEDAPYGADGLERFMAGQMPDPQPKWIRRLPMFRLAALLGAKGYEEPEKPPKGGNSMLSDLRPNAQETAEGVRRIARYLENKKMIEALAAAYQVRPIFVWQPVSVYKYDLRYHPFDLFREYHHVGATRAGYEHFAALAARPQENRDLVWCADIQEGRQEALYMDRVHYTAKFSEEVARCVSQQIAEKKLLPIH